MKLEADPMTYIVNARRKTVGLSNFGFFAMEAESMKIINASAKVDWIETGNEILRRLEAYGRTAYKSEDRITEDSAEKFIRMIVKRGHHSVLEHVAVSVRVICDRGITHEIVRHRIASYTQESTRYCNYGENGEVSFILPKFLQGAQSTSLYTLWWGAMKDAEIAYLQLLNEGAVPQEARSVLPNSLKTEIVMTMNLREWLHFFELRTAPSAHPDMQVVANAILSEFRAHVPVIFGEPT